MLVVLAGLALLLGLLLSALNRRAGPRFASSNVFPICGKSRWRSDCTPRTTSSGSRGTTTV